MTPADHWGDFEDWYSLLHRDAQRPADLKSTEWRNVLDGKCVLITGAGGWIGSRLARRLAGSDIRKLVLLDSSEGNLYEIDQALLSGRGNAKHVVILGSVCDTATVDELFEQHRPEIVYHASALKHVPLMESNPFAVVTTNTLGTSVIMKAARRYGCKQVVMVSTDKAADPVSLMGASKRMAELLVLHHRNEDISTRVVRLVNVLGSSGSVVPLFMRQIAEGGPVTVSDPNVRRFFMTTSDAVESLLNALAPSCADGLLVAETGDSIRVIDLVSFLISRSAQALPGRNPVEREQLGRISVAYTTLRPGDKMEESLTSGRETYVNEQSGQLREVLTPLPEREELDAGIDALAFAVQRRNLEDLLQAILLLVPEYRPSSLILEQVGAASRVEVTR
jgi:FlaA1/EpsC-like NDP-sugar epimerase